MQTEFDIPNTDHLLRPGLYVNISFKVPRPHPVVSVPDAALIFNGDGLQVATVEDGRARMHKVTIEHDLGTVAELSDGLRGGEHVIISPPADLTDGQKVNAPPESGPKEAASDKSPPA
jgi:multidrug efflux pump subunit AcrA (membrane-fusion protein)